MTWFAAGAATLAVGTSYLSAQSSTNTAIRNANSASKAEGEAITKERLNQTIRNSYATSLAQMQLGLRKRQLAQQGSDIRAASLSAKGDVALGIASTSSIGQSTNAVVSDIDMKTQQALDMNSDQFENDVENYNRELQMMVINTDQSAPTVRQNEYNGPSGGEMFGMALLQGVTSFASSYAMQRMQLGLGGGTQGSSGTGLKLSSSPNLGYMGGGQGLYALR